MRYQRKFNSYTHVFDVQQLNDVMGNSARCDISLKWKIKMAANNPEIAAKWIRDTNHAYLRICDTYERNFKSYLYFRGL